MNQSEQNRQSTLEELQQAEDELRMATKKAEDDLAQGRTTKLVFDELRTRYLIAKQTSRKFSV